jgi:hypothetical protein
MLELMFRPPAGSETQPSKARKAAASFTGCRQVKFSQT